MNTPLSLKTQHSQSALYSPSLTDCMGIKYDEPINKRVASDSSRIGPAETSSLPSLYTTNLIKCVYTNAQCLQNKLPELNEVCHECCPDLVAITETWFQPNVTDNELAVSQMSLLRRDRLSHGGGVAPYHSHRL